MRLSPFVRQWHYDNTILLYHSLNMQVAYIAPENSLHKPDALPDHIKNELLLKEMLVPEDFDSTAYFLKRKKECLFLLAQKGSLNISTLFLLMSNNCNYSCRYCFISKCKKVLSLEICTKALDIFLEDPSSKRKCIRFYGGEPLLYFKEIVDIVEYVEGKNVSCEFAIPTNGSLITDECASFFREKKIDVMVSLDGPREINDTMRVYPGGKGTFEDTVKGIEILQNHGIAFSLACTINTHNWAALGEVAHFLYTTFSPRAVAFNYPIVCNVPYLESEKVFHSVVNAYRALKLLETVPAEFYEERIRPFVKKIPFLQYCGGCGSHIVLNPEGYIGPCFAFPNDSDFWIDVNTLNSFADFYTLPLFKEWRARSVFNIPQCFGCESILLCGGGCLYNSYQLHGSIWHPDTRYCELSKKFLEFLVRSSNPFLENTPK